MNHCQSGISISYIFKTYALFGACKSCCQSRWCGNMAVPTVVTPRTTVYAKRRKMVIYIYSK